MNTYGQDIGEQLASRRAHLARELDLAREALNTFDDAWGAQDYEWLRDAGHLSADQCAHMMKRD